MNRDNECFFRIYTRPEKTNFELEIRTRPVRKINSFLEKKDWEQFQMECVDAFKKRSLKIVETKLTKSLKQENTKFKQIVKEYKKAKKQKKQHQFQSKNKTYLKLTQVSFSLIKIKYYLITLSKIFFITQTHLTWLVWALYNTFASQNFYKKKL